MSEPGAPPPPPKPPADQPTRRLTIDEMGLTTADIGEKDLGANAFLYAWFQLFKTAQIHALENQAIRRPVQKFLDVVTRVVSMEGRISFQAKDRALFTNGIKLKLSSEEYEIAYGVFEFLEERGMGGFVIEGSLDEEKVHELLRIFVYAPPAQKKLAAIDAALRASGIPMRVNKTLGATSRSTAEVVLERRGYTFLTYSKLVVLLRTLLAEEKQNATRQQFLVRKITRTIHALVDICLEDDHTFLGVSSVKSGEAYAPHHAANCTILAIALGDKIGLSKMELADLGLAAAFHDIGLKFVPDEILSKKGPLDASERAAVELHPLKAIEFLLEEKAFTSSLLTRMVVAFEHHLGAAGGGYPAAFRTPELFSRIVAIVDVFDALTTDRPWRKAILPDEALGMMMGELRERFDPILLKVFVNTVGLYPIGSLLRLSSGELGVVIYGGAEGERAHRPLVAIVGPDGRPDNVVDLMEKAESGAFLRNVVSSEDPAKYGIQVSGLLANCGVA